MREDFLRQKNKILRKIKFWSFFLATLVRKNYRQLGLGVLVILLLVYFFRSFDLSDLGGGETITIGMVGDFTQTSLPPTAGNLISKGLTKIDQNGLPKPSLSKSWDVGNLGKTYIFRLIDNLSWIDGKKVKTTNIDLKIDQAQISTPDQNTIRIDLPSPFSSLPALLAKPVFRNSSNIGIGPYKIDRLVKNNGSLKSLKIKTKEKGLPKSITFKFYPTQKQVSDAFLLGEVDVIWGSIQKEGLPPKARVKALDSYPYFVALFFNLDQTLFSEKEVRQALGLAIDKGVFNQITAYSSIAPNSWAYNANLKKNGKDLAKAQKIINEKVTTDKKITLTTLDQWENDAQKIAQSWQELGLEVKVEKVSAVPKEFQVLLAAQEVGDDPDQYSLWHSTQKGSSNISRYESAKIDKFLEDGRSETNIDKRREIYQEFQRFLVEDSPATFLYWPNNFLIYSKDKENEIKKIEELLLE